MKEVPLKDTDYSILADKPDHTSIALKMLSPAATGVKTRSSVHGILSDSITTETDSCQGVSTNLRPALRSHRASNQQTVCDKRVC